MTFSQKKFKSFTIRLAIVFSLSLSCQESELRQPNRPSDDESVPPGYLESKEQSVQARQPFTITLKNSTLEGPAEATSVDSMVRMGILEKAPERPQLVDLGAAKGDIVEITFYNPESKETLPSTVFAENYLLKQNLVDVESRKNINYVVIAGLNTESEKISLLSNAAIEFEGDQLSLAGVVAVTGLAVPNAVIFAVEVEKIPTSIIIVDSAEDLNNDDEDDEGGYASDGTEESSFQLSYVTTDADKQTIRLASKNGNTWFFDDLDFQLKDLNEPVQLAFNHLGDKHLIYDRNVNPNLRNWQHLRQLSNSQSWVEQHDLDFTSEGSFKWDSAFDSEGTVWWSMSLIGCTGIGHESLSIGSSRTESQFNDFVQLDCHPDASNAFYGSSIAIDSSDKIHVVASNMVSASRDNLTYFSYKGGVKNSKQIDLAGCQESGLSTYFSIALDANDALHIAYACANEEMNESNGGCILGYFVDGVGSAAILPAAQTGLCSQANRPSLAINTFGAAYIAFPDRVEDEPQIYLLHNSDADGRPLAGIATSNFVDPITVGTYTANSLSLALSPTGEPHIFYLDESYQPTLISGSITGVFRVPEVIEICQLGNGWCNQNSIGNIVFPTVGGRNNY